MVHGVTYMFNLAYVRLTLAFLLFSDCVFCVLWNKTQYTRHTGADVTVSLSLLAHSRHSLFGACCSPKDGPPAAHAPHSNSNVLDHSMFHSSVYTVRGVTLFSLNRTHYNDCVI